MESTRARAAGFQRSGRNAAGKCSGRSLRSGHNDRAGRLNNQLCGSVSHTLPLVERERRKGGAIGPLRKGLGANRSGPVGRFHERSFDARPLPMTEWLTYAEAATRFGISSEAVRQIAIRRHWPRRKPNDAPFGQVQVGVPDDFEARPRPPVQHPYERPDEQPSDTRSNGLFAGALAALEEAVGTLRERAEGAERRAEVAEARTDRALALLADVESVLVKERDRSGRAEAAIAGERAKVDALRERLDSAERDLVVAQYAAQTAQQAAAVLQQANTAWKARGRLRRAWDGWRSR